MRLDVHLNLVITSCIFFGSMRNEVVPLAILVTHHALPCAIAVPIDEVSLVVGAIHHFAVVACVDRVLGPSVRSESVEVGGVESGIGTSCPKIGPENSFLRGTVIGVLGCVTPIGTHFIVFLYFIYLRNIFAQSTSRAMPLQLVLWIIWIILTSLRAINAIFILHNVIVPVG